MATASRNIKRPYAEIASVHIYKSQSIEESLTPPETPPFENGQTKPVHAWPEPDNSPEELTRKRRKTVAQEENATEVDDFNVPHQEVLLLHAAKERYVHTEEQPIPDLTGDREMLIAVEVIGLNPIDWKAPYVFHIAQWLATRC